MWQRGMQTGIEAMCGHSVTYYLQLFQPMVCRKTKSPFQTRTDQSRGIQAKVEIKMFQQVCRNQGSKLKTSPEAQLLGTPSSGKSSLVTQEMESRAATSFQRSLLVAY